MVERLLYKREDPKFGLLAPTQRARLSGTEEVETRGSLGLPASPDKQRQETSPGLARQPQLAQSVDSSSSRFSKRLPQKIR